MSAQHLHALTPAPALDARFIEDNRLIDDYLNRTLPPLRARELESWCRKNPQYLIDLELPDRLQTMLQLLEASGRSVDFEKQAPTTPRWRSPWMLSLAGVTFASLLVIWALAAKLSLARSELADATLRRSQGSLVQPDSSTSVRIVPDQRADGGRASIVLGTTKPELIDLRVDMNFTKATQFRVVIDKQDQGRALVLDDVAKDSNGDLRLSFNTSGLTAGIYRARIEALPSHAGWSSLPTVPLAWLSLDMR